jgi:ankyrin repeat protein
MVKLLVSKGADVNKYDPLLAAIKKSQDEIALFLISKGADVKCADLLFGWTALHYAAMYSGQNLTEKLIAGGADIHATEMDGNTALHLAVRQNRPEIVELLVGHGAVVDVENLDGATPLSMAEKAKEKAIIQILKKPRSN